MTRIKFMTAALTVAVATAVGGFSPPSGRPPYGPLQRVDPKLYEMSFGVTLRTHQRMDNGVIERYNLSGTPIVMPIIYLGTYSRVDSDTVLGRLWLDNRTADPHFELKSGFPYSTNLATLMIDTFAGQEVRWQLSYTVQVWSSRIDDEKAAAIPWPEEWPKEVRDGLQPQLYVESDDPLFAETVQRVSEGNLRFVPPYLAAKDLIRYCVNQIQTSGDGVDRGNLNMLRGLTLVGARQAAIDGRGSPHDLVCACVAMLRAAGIPARPVIGVEEDRRGRSTFVSWGEFFLPDAGWVPFDPQVMRGKGVRTLDVHKPWPELGTLRNLNQRIPLAYHFIPPATVQTPRCPAIWGWDPRPGPDNTETHQIQVNIVSRGKGVDDPP